MITTYKKLASLAVQIGQPDASKKYLAQASELLNKFRSANQDEEKSPQEIREELEDRAALLF